MGVAGVGGGAGGDATGVGGSGVGGGVGVLCPAGGVGVLCPAGVARCARHHLVAAARVRARYRSTSAGVMHCVHVLRRTPC